MLNGRVGCHGGEIGSSHKGLRPTPQLFQFVHPALSPTVFTELSPIKPEDSSVPLLQTILYSTLWVKKKTVSHYINFQTSSFLTTATPWPFV